MQRLIGANPRLRVVSLYAFIALVSFLIASSFSDDDPVPIGGVIEIRDWFNGQQEFFIRIAPPTGYTLLQSGFPDVLAFDPDDLPPTMVQEMTGQVEYDCPVYPLYLVEDPETRDFVIFNEDEEEIYSVAAPSNYDPTEYTLSKYPDLYSGAYTSEEISDILATYDPSRIQISVKLVPDEYYSAYVSASLEAAASASSALFGGFGSAQSHTTNDLWLEINGVTNGCTAWTADLTIHTPEGDTNSSYDVFYAPALDSPTDWQFLMRCPTNIIAQTNAFARYLCEEQGFFFLTQTNGDLTVTTNVTPQEMAEMLVPPWVTVTNATYTGATVARGTFTNGNGCGLPIESGVLLSSGYITNAIGPNDDDGSSLVGGLGKPGDTDLGKLVGNNPTLDAALLEFDILSTNSCVLEFQYVFASEEYPEWIGQYNDPMAIFVSTNRVGTQWIYGSTNSTALVPCTTSVLVGIGTVNGGQAGGVSPTNAQLYVDNRDPNYSAKDPYAMGVSVFNVQYDGMTVLLAAHAFVHANVTNRVKIGVADFAGDTADEVYDSVVLLKPWSPVPCQ